MLFLKGVGPAMIVPVEMSNLFGSLGFIKKSGSGGSVFWLPCMVVGPCDIPCEPLRSLCGTMYGNVRNSFTFVSYYFILSLISVLSLFDFRSLIKLSCIYLDLRIG